MRNEMAFERKRMSRKYSSMFFDEIMHISGKRSSYAFFDDAQSIKRRFSLDL